MRKHLSPLLLSAALLSVSGCLSDTLLDPAYEDAYADECGAAFGPAPLDTVSGDTPGVPAYGAGELSSAMAGQWTGVLVPADGSDELDLDLNLGVDGEPLVYWFEDVPAESLGLCPPRVEQAVDVSMNAPDVSLDLAVEMTITALGEKLETVSGMVVVPRSSVGDADLDTGSTEDLVLMLDVLSAEESLSGVLTRAGDGPEQVVATFSAYRGSRRP